MKKILIVVDMQNDFITGSLGCEAAVGVVKKVAKKIKFYNENGGFVIATLDTHSPNYLHTLEGEKLPIIHCIKGTKGHEIDENIKQYLNKKTIYVEKNAFSSVELGRVIKQIADKSDFQIELVGLCTDICVISCAILLRVMFENTKISVDSSCCVGTSKAKHDASLEVMKSCQIDII